MLPKQWMLCVTLSAALFVNAQAQSPEFRSHRPIDSDGKAWMSQFPKLVSSEYLNSPMAQSLQKQLSRQGFDSRRQQDLINQLTTGDDELFQSIQRLIDQNPNSNLSGSSQNPFPFPEFSPLKDVLPQAFQPENDLRPLIEKHLEPKDPSSNQAPRPKQKNAVSAAASAIQKSVAKKFDFEKIKKMAPNLQRQASQIPVPKFPSRLSSEQIDRLQQLQKRMQEIGKQQNRPAPSTAPRESAASSLGKNVTVPKELLDTFFEALDKSGTDLLSAYLDPDRVQDLSWIQQSAGKMQRRIKAMNRKINQLSSRSPSRDTGIQYNYDTVLQDQLNASNRMMLIAVFSLIALVVAILWYRLARGVSPPIDVRRTSVSIPVEQVKERGSFVRACNQIASSYFGDPSRYWHHSRMFHELEHRKNQSMDRLGALYEFARYAPPESKMSCDEITLARNLLKDIQE